MRSPSVPPRLVLGVFDGTHDAGAALVRDGRLVAACNEERFTRQKGQGGWPADSIDACLAIAGVQPEQVDQVAVAGLVNPNPGLRMARRLQRRWRLDEEWFYRPDPTPGSRLGDWLQFDSPFPRMRSDAAAARAWRPALGVGLRRHLRRHLGARAATVPLAFHDHHRCHAASAWWTSGEEEGLVVVADGLGDGLATTIWHGSRRGLKRLDARPYPHSYGLLYATITGYLGFRPFRHEGKLSGLAPHGDASAVPLPFPFEGPPTARRFTQRFGMPLRPWLDQLAGCRREDICAWLQLHLEQEVANLVAAWVEQTGLSRVSVAGGVFANVRLNQVVSALPQVDRLWVFPHMGDGGLAVGAALESRASAPGSAEELPHAFLGPRWDDDALDRAVSGKGLSVQRPADPTTQVADALAQGQVVARFEGAMEMGPRALGHRSILAQADADMPARLNRALQRSDFMPFAPVMAEDDVDDWVVGVDPVRGSARFMTVALDARPALREQCPAAVHIDGTLRPQLVGPDVDPGMCEIVTAYRERTGRPALINTSFNMHEEPIVCSPDDAVRAFLASGLDLMVLGPLVVRGG